MGEFMISLPPQRERDRIASVLGVLDDKIEVGKRLTTILEEIAYTEFRARFVDFSGINEFEESEIGRIPRGWKVSRLTKDVEILSGGTPNTAEAKYWEGNIPWISVKDTVPGPYVTRTEKHISGLALSEAKLQLYPRETVVVTARGTVGNVALMAEEMTLNQSCYAARGRNGVGQLYIYFVLRHSVDMLRARSHGSVFSTITRSTFDSVDIAQAPCRVLTEFEQDVHQLFDLICAGAREATTLAAIRDTLLPKLLSGEIRAPDTRDPEEVIGPVAEALTAATR